MDTAVKVSTCADENSKDQRVNRATNDAKDQADCKE